MATPMETNLPALKLLAVARPLIIGHRGYSARAPENTMLSFQFARIARSDLIELDYHHSRDGVPVVIHDDTLDRTTDARAKWKQKHLRVADRSAAEIRSLDAGSWFAPPFAGAKVPLLSEALDFICGSGGVALVEHKSGSARTCVRFLRERSLINRVVIISFNWSFLREFHALESKQLLGTLGPPIGLADGRKPPRFTKAFSEKWLDEIAATGARLVVWNHRVSKSAVTAALRRGLPVWVYTIDDLKLARSLVERGVSGIITNDPYAIAPIARGLSEG
jgi:glycerophosphoryl diester phosphodiesterase